MLRQQLHSCSPLIPMGSYVVLSTAVQADKQSVCQWLLHLARLAAAFLLAASPGNQDPGKPSCHIPSRVCLCAGKILSAPSASQRVRQAWQGGPRSTAQLQACMQVLPSLQTRPYLRHLSKSQD